MWLRVQPGDDIYPTLIETKGGHTITLTASLGQPTWGKVVFRVQAEVQTEVTLFEGPKEDATAFIEHLWSDQLQPGRYVE